MRATVFLSASVLDRLKEAPNMISAIGVVAAVICASGFMMKFGISMPMSWKESPITEPIIMVFLAIPFRIGIRAKEPPRNISNTNTASIL